jgi:drug/metabolite transporter (DMT)-like permease
MWAGRKVPKSTWAAIAVAIFGLALIEGVVPIPGLEAHDTKEALSIVSDAVSDVVSTSVLTGEVVQSNPFEVLDSALSLPLESVTDIAEVATVETVQSLYGDFAILISAVVFAVQVFRTDVLANEEHLGTKEMMGMCSIQLFVVTLFFGGTLLNDVPRDDGQLSTLFTNSLAELSTFDWHSVPWFLVAYTGVVTTAFALYAETVALKYIPSEKASVIYTTEPLWGAAFAYVLLGERMGINGYIGGALILASSFLSSSSNKAIVLPGEEEEASAMKKIE